MTVRTLHAAFLVFIFLQMGCAGASFEGVKTDTNSENSSNDGGDPGTPGADPIADDNTTPDDPGTPATPVDPVVNNPAPATGCAAKACVQDSRAVSCQGSNKCTVSSCGRYSFRVPNGVTQIHVKAWGGGGGSGSAGVGGGGGFASSRLSVTPGETLNILVAKGGCEDGGGAGGSFVVRGSTSILLAAGGGGGGGSDGNSGIGATDTSSAGAAGGSSATGGSGFASSSATYGSGAGGTSATSSGPGLGGQVISYGSYSDRPNTTAGTSGAAVTGGVGGGRSAAMVTRQSASWEVSGNGEGNGSGGGGGSGYFGGGGGAGRYTYFGAGGGGGSSHAAGTEINLIGGSGQTPGGISDSDYGNAAGLGAYRKQINNSSGYYRGDAGSDGRVVISW